MEVMATIFSIWQWKLRIARWLCKLYPITTFVVEDVAAVTRRNQRQWNSNFSPLEVGKQWFYEELERLGRLVTCKGYETREFRDMFGLEKSGNRKAETFETHCIDSWVLANSWVRGHTKPENKAILLLVPLRFHRRQLHAMQPLKGGVRRRYGGTRSLGFKRGSWVKHPTYGLAYAGGTMHNRISLHSLNTGKRLCQNARPEDCQLLTYSSWRRKEVADSSPG